MHTRERPAGRQPCRDLLVTPEHCLFLNGGLVPACLLVNNRSIAWSAMPYCFEVYRVETATHSIMRAGGVWTESYLDTGNRRGFTAADGLSRIDVSRTWQEDAAAPLTVGRVIVEPICREIEARAARLGSISGAFRAGAHA